jgi:hypothetical protein
MSFAPALRVGAAGPHLAGQRVAAPLANNRALTGTVNQGQGSILLLKSAFNTGPGPWPTNRYASVAGGRYNVIVNPGRSLRYHPRKPNHLTDGAISAVVQLSGKGQGGLMARFHAGPKGRRSMYACWMSNDGTFGCLKVVNDRPTIIVATRHSALIRPNAVNTISLLVVGNEIALQINGRTVSTYTEIVGSPLPGGAWGVYGANPTSGAFTAHYDSIAISKPVGMVPSNGGVDAATVLLHSTFGMDPGVWPITKRARIVHGYYTIAVDTEHYAQYHPARPSALGDGTIAAAVKVGAPGRVGLMARFHATTDDKWSMYACWIANDGKFGCLKDVTDTRAAIVTARHTAFVRANAINTIALSVIGRDVIFRVNGRLVAVYTDSSSSPLAAGYWGLYLDNNTNSPFTARYQAVAIARS